MAEKPTGKKLGGLSRNTWLIAGLAMGALAYLYWKRKQASASNSGLISTLPSSMPGGAGNASTTLPSGTDLSFQSLQDWMSHVQGWANSLGFDAANVQNALQAYSLGTCLSQSQYNIINKALATFGQPPQAPFQGIVLCSPTADTPPVVTPPILPPLPPLPPPPVYAPPPPPPLQPPNPPFIPPTPIVVPPIIKRIVQFFSGSGYGPGNTNPVEETGTGNRFSWIPDANAFNALPAGITTYYQPTEGTFIATRPNMGLAPGTPQFYRLGDIQPRNPVSNNQYQYAGN